MNIRISIKDCDQHSHHLSEVDQKKKSMLYAPPQRDTNPRPAKSQDKNTTLKDGPAYRESEKQMLQALNKKNAKNAQQQTAVQEHKHLQRQNEIIEQNQRVLDHALKKSGEEGRREEEAGRRELREGLEQIRRDVQEIKKVREDIMGAVKEFRESGGGLKGSGQQGVPQVNSMNSNLKNLVEVSQNHLEGLENMEGIKALQNFNLEGYSAAISSIKKQINQYQRESEAIERELKIRSAKLEKMQVSPNFEELYKPYEEHLAKRVNKIDLHSLQEQVYEKLGTFDYGKFQFDVGQIMLEARDELNNFPIVCKEFRIQVPEVKFDPRELRKMDVKIPSVLDEYKASRGIKFQENSPNHHKKSNPHHKRPSHGKMLKTDQIQQRLKGTGPTPPTNPMGKPNSNSMGRPYPRSQPIDLAKNTKLIKEYEKRPTILENNDRKEKKQLEQEMRRDSKEKPKGQQEFEKYLENRAKEQLELIYKERKENLKRMQQELVEDCQNPVFISLGVDHKKSEGMKPEVAPAKQKESQGARQEGYDESFEKESEGEKEAGSKRREEESEEKKAIREVGKQVLRQKLKDMIGVKKEPTVQPAMRGSEHGQQMQGMAQGFINMINHTLTQANSNLASIIDRKVEHSQQRRPTSLQRRERPKVQIPKLEPFKAPPTFNMTVPPQYYQPVPPQYYQPAPAPVPAPAPAPEPPRKIVVEDYKQLMPKDYDNLQDLNISDDDSEAESSDMMKYDAI